MKYSTTFSEMSEIFALIAKADNKIGAYLQSENEYANACENYRASGYKPSFGEKQHLAYEAMVKARRSMNACFKKLLVAFQADSSDFNDIRLRELAKRDYEPCSFLNAAKDEAIRLAKYIEL